MERENNYRIEDEIEIDLKELMFHLVGKWKTVCLSVLFCALLGLCAAMYLQTDTYVSKTSVYVNSQQKEATNYSNLQTGNLMTKDYEVLVKGRSVLETVIHDLQLKISYRTLKNMVSVSVPEDTRIVEITVQSTDPYLSKDIADSVREVSSQKIVGIMGVGEVITVEKANLPETGSESDLMRNTILGGMLGAVLACGIYTVMFVFNDTICTQEDVERYLGLGVLGTIPVDSVLKKERNKSLKEKKRGNKH